MTGPPTKQGRRRGASTPRPLSSLIREPEGYTAAPPSRVTRCPYSGPILNRYPGRCWACGLRVEPGAGQLLSRDFRGGRGWRLLHSPKPRPGMTALERFASGCPGPPVVQVLKPGQHAPGRKVRAA